MSDEKSAKPERFILSKVTEVHDNGTGYPDVTVEGTIGGKKVAVEMTVFVQNKSTLIVDGIVVEPASGVRPGHGGHPRKGRTSLQLDEKDRAVLKGKGLARERTEQERSLRFFGLVPVAAAINKLPKDELSKFEDAINAALEAAKKSKAKGPVLRPISMTPGGEKADYAMAGPLPSLAGLAAAEHQGDPLPPPLPGTGGGRQHT
jgi:hypothetical protein